MSVLLALVFFLLIAVTYILRERSNYWKKRNVPYLKPLPLFGNYKDTILLKSWPPLVARAISEQFPDAPYVGTFFGTSPVLLVKDPELIKIITTKDFYYFHSRELSDHTHKEVMTRSLSFTQGDNWKIWRQNLNTFFSFPNLKDMFCLVKQCSVEFEDLIKREADNRQVEITELMARYTVDCISSCAFGIHSNAMGDKAQTNPFNIIRKQILWDSSLGALKFYMRSIWPKIFYGLGFKAYDKRAPEFFYKLLTNVFEARGYKPSNRHDFVDLLMGLITKDHMIKGDGLTKQRIGERKKVQLKLDDELLVAQCVAIFFGGNEPTSVTLAFALYELAKSKEVQDRAIAEVDDYLKRHPEGVEYDCVTELPYLDACIREAMRLYPILGTMNREVMENYTFPSGLSIEKGTTIHIPILHLHHNPDYFPEPEVYRPERFLGEEKTKIRPYTYMPFGEGSRICIGKKLGKMLMLPAMVAIFKKYRLVLAEGMQRTVELEPGSFLPHPVGGIHLKFVPRT